MNKTIVYVHQGKDSATFRYRAQMPADEVSRINGFKAMVNTGAADILVFSKPMPTDLSMAEAAKEQGCKIVVDLSDDHFQHPAVGKLYRDLARHADAMVCPTAVMRDRIKEATGKEALVIPEPYEFEELPPHADGMKFLWFGHKTNLGGLLQWTPHLKNIDLTIVTNKNDKVPDYVPWSLETMREQLAARNIVLLPTMRGAEYKSPNRLVNAIRSGCFVVAENHPAHKEFRRFAWVGPFVTGIRWAVSFRDQLNDLVAEGQEYIRDRYSPTTIGKQWAELFASM